MPRYGSALAIQSFALLLAYLESSWPLAFAAFIFGVCNLLFPPLARFVDSVWMKIGEWLARIVNPITLSILFVFIITPFGLFARLMKWLNPAFNVRRETQLITVENCPSRKSFSKPF